MLRQVFDHNFVVVDHNMVVGIHNSSGVLERVEQFRVHLPRVA